MLYQLPQMSICLNEAPVFFEDGGAVVGLSEMLLNKVENGIGAGDLVVFKVCVGESKILCILPESLDQNEVLGRGDILQSCMRLEKCTGIMVMGLQKEDLVKLRQGVAVKCPTTPLGDFPIYLVYGDTESSVCMHLEALQGQLIFACETSISNQGVGGLRSRKPK